MMLLKLLEDKRSVFISFFRGKLKNKIMEVIERKNIVLDYWNNYRHFEDGVKIFLINKFITREKFYEYYKEFVNTCSNPWIEDELKTEK